MANDALRRIKRDRHGRGASGPALPHSSPRYRTKDAKFATQVQIAIADLEEYGANLNRITFRTEPVPGAKEVVLSSGAVPLGRIERGNPDVVVLYQRAIELRSANLATQLEVIKDVLAELIGRLMGKAPSELDPNYRGPSYSR